MGTKISWADESWNLIIGCSKISVGCANCYAERMAGRQACMQITKHPYGNTHYIQVVKKGQRKWNGKTVFVESALTKPLHWRKPRKIFVVSMGDLFHESVPFEWIDRVFAVMALCPQHEFKVLTKRAGRMKEYVNDYNNGFKDTDIPIMHVLETEFMYEAGLLFGGKIESYCDYIGVDPQLASSERSLYDMDNPPELPLPNIHLGVTVENQDNVGRIADLIRTPAAKRFVSFEPLLEDVYTNPELLMEIDYCFIGCESGPKARLCSIETIDELMGRCMDSGVKIHVKQIPLNGKCNKNIDEWPEEFRIREV